MISKDMVMPVDVFVGSGGDIIILQEWPELAGEKYIRIFIDPKDAGAVCRAIKAAALKAGADQ
jgi:hypothetical protein